MIQLLKDKVVLENQESCDLWLALKEPVGNECAPGVEGHPRWVEKPGQGLDPPPLLTSLPVFMQPPPPSLWFVHIEYSFLFLFALVFESKYKKPGNFYFKIQVSSFTEPVSLQGRNHLKPSRDKPLRQYADPFIFSQLHHSWVFLTLSLCHNDLM